MPDQLIQDFIRDHKLPDSFTEVALKWFTPLALGIERHHSSASKPLFIGINGSQGSGKSTLTSFLTEYLSQECQLTVANLSLDDFYLTHQQRNELSINTHPLLKSRGVPGTHDVELLKHTLTALAQNQLPISLPRFNKAIDDPYPQNEWPVISEQVDVVIFEGWCWGVSAQDEQALSPACNELEQNHDPDGVWRQYVNQQIIEHYQALYQKMDFWLMLQAPSFDCIYKWRLEQEHKLKAAVAESGTDDSKVMTDEQVSHFIQHFQRLTEYSLTELPKSCDLVFQLNPGRQIQQTSGNKVDKLFGAVNHGN